MQIRAFVKGKYRPQLVYLCFGERVLGLFALNDNDRLATRYKCVINFPTLSVSQNQRWILELPEMGTESL